MLSLPAPPLIVSGPAPPLRMSSPPRPLIVSLPPRPVMVSGPSVPVSRCGGLLPTMFSPNAVAANASDAGYGQGEQCSKLFGHIYSFALGVQLDN